MVEVIGIGDDDNEPHRGGGGGNSSSDEDDDDNTPVDPQDNSSIAELLEKNSTTMDEKEFHRLTQKNTNFNSIKTNLLGKTKVRFYFISLFVLIIIILSILIMIIFVVRG